MTFTDDDLERLKEWCETPFNRQVGSDMTFSLPHLKALLARLEASERFMEYVMNQRKMAWNTETDLRLDQIDNFHEAWRKGVGK